MLNNVFKKIFYRFYAVVYLNPNVRCKYVHIECQLSGRQANNIGNHIYTNFFLPNACTPCKIMVSMKNKLNHLNKSLKL